LKQIAEVLILGKKGNLYASNLRNNQPTVKGWFVIRLYLLISSLIHALKCSL